MATNGVDTNEFEEIDRFEGGVGWLSNPGETMERASHALVSESASGDELWLVDPVDFDGLDGFLSEFGSVAGVVLLLARHKRDAAAIANRHDVSVHLPIWLSGAAGDIDAPVERFEGELDETGYQLRKVSTPFWQEGLLYKEETGVLVLAEALGTAAYMHTSSERLGVHPVLRVLPPSGSFRGLSPEHVLVGHGAGIHENATAALEDAFDGARGRAPSLYAKALRVMVG